MKKTYIKPTTLAVMLNANGILAGVSFAVDTENPTDQMDAKESYVDGFEEE